MGENLENIERTLQVLLDNARDVLRELKERTEKGKVDILFLLDVQSSFILGLSDVSLYAFVLEREELVEEVYETFLEGYELMERNGLLVSDSELGLQMGVLKNLNAEQGFSLDRRLSILGSPKDSGDWIRHG
ncbi:MAG: hypothetical protein PWQ95_1999 [Thermococcaceae archaeon]|nr:hypothetical protein [Thermococcaceae archaeon]